MERGGEPVKFFLVVTMGNDAMRTRGHLAAALQDVAVKVKAGQRDGKVMDVNGNSVGKFKTIGKEVKQTED